MSSIVLSNSMTSSAPSPSFVNMGVFCRKFMPIFAMGHGSFFSPACLTAKRKTAFKNFAFFIYKFIKSFCSFGSINNSVVFKTIFLSNIANKVLNIINRYFFSNSAISLLFFTTRPFAILWSVIAIIINSVYGITLRSIAHIGNKLIKIVYPLVANFNTSATVIWVMFIVKVIASCLHALPNLVKRVWIFKRHNNLLYGDYSIKR